MNTSNTPPMAPGNVPMTLVEAVALAAFSSLIANCGGTYGAANQGEHLAVAAWDYAEVWMRIRGRRSYFPSLQPSPDDVVSDSLAAFRARLHTVTDATVAEGGGL